jgi:flagellin-like hook-associated protein FlgL
LRSDIVSLQNELNALARRVAERKVVDPHIDFSADDLSAMFEDVRDLNFDDLEMIPAERTELQSISNRIESMLRTGLRAAEEMFQITQDQINALGGAGSVNFDGSTVFSGTAIENWQDETADVDGARTVLENIRAGFQQALTDLQDAMVLGAEGALEAMNQAVFSIVGTLGTASPTETVFSTVGVANPTHIADPDNPGGFTTVPPAATHIANPTFGDPAFILESDPSDATHILLPSGDFVLLSTVVEVGPDGSPGTGYMSNGEGGFIPLPADATHIANPADTTTAFILGGTPPTHVEWGGEFVPLATLAPTHVVDPENPGDFIPATPGTHVVDAAAPGGFRPAGPGETGTHIAVRVSVFELADTAAGETGTHIADATVPGGFREATATEIEGGLATHVLATGLADQPSNNILGYMETLLDLATDVLGNVNLESNAMWFQIGPNSMQGMILQLQGIHTGILGGGRGDLAMLIDVREHSGIPISEQLAIIDIAEGIVNGQRAQLGAVQNRLEFTRQSLDISSENLSAAESRIRDTDMAREMMRFTAAQVLQQAGISMLAQANQLPSSILQLLQ